MSAERSNAVDRFRGMAILLVVAFHYFPAAFFFGWMGVNLFFVLSGYLIGGILIDNRRSRSYFGTFYARRCFRIAPLYLLDVLLFAAVIGLDQPLWHYLVLAQSMTWIANGTVPFDWMSPTWTLAVEEQFYLLLPLLIRIVPSRKLAPVALGLAFIAPVYRIVVAQALDLDWPWADQLLPGCLDSLFLGVFVACLVRSREALAAIAANRMALYVATGMSFAGVSVIFALRPGSLLLSSCLAATFALALLTVVTAAPARLATHRGPLCWLGIGAYSIYLFHMPLLYLAKAIAADGLGARLLATTLLVPVAAVSWRYIERPFIEFARRWQYRFPPRSRELRAAEAAP